MSKEDVTIDPKPIISFMLAVAVGFWGNELAGYFDPLLSAGTLRSEMNKAFEKAAKDPDGFIITQLALDQFKAEANKGTKVSTKTLAGKIADLTPANTKMDPATEKEVSRLISEHIRGIRDTSWWLTLVSGGLFLIDLLCIVWWYARYIYRVEAKASFGTYFLDFIICSMFGLAANSWTDPRTFALTTAFASVFLITRFWLLYRSSSASLTDRRILKRAALFLIFALLIAMTGLAVFENMVPERMKIIGLNAHGLPAVLSAIGIILTLYLKRKIDIAVAIYVARYGPNHPAHLVWPNWAQADNNSNGNGGDVSENMQEEDPNRPGQGQGRTGSKQDSTNENLEEYRERIRNRSQRGLKDFEDLFLKYGQHDRIFSRVHSQPELRVQSYILGLPSCKKEKYAREITKKAFMVAASHWLDDLVDGRDEVFVLKQLQKGQLLSDELEDAEVLFERIYRPLIVKHTGPKFYKELRKLICDSCLFPFNRKYMFLGLNRVAYGAVIFSPKITSELRQHAMDAHNVFLKDWNVEGQGKHFENRVETLLDEIVSGGDAGSIMLGLTTKTAQEIALSSESHQMNVGLSILYSILYTPLIYYHNIQEELDSGEMIALQAFDTDYDLWIPWLSKARNAIETVWHPDRAKAWDYQYESARRDMRIDQIKMAYRCFAPKLPKNIREKLGEIYLRPIKKLDVEEEAASSEQGHETS